MLKAEESEDIHKKFLLARTLSFETQSTYIYAKYDLSLFMAIHREKFEYRDSVGHLLMAVTILKQVGNLRGMSVTTSICNCHKIFEEYIMLIHLSQMLTKTAVIKY